MSSSQSIQRGSYQTVSHQTVSCPVVSRPAVSRPDVVHPPVVAAELEDMRSHSSQPTRTLLDNVVVFPDGSVMWVTAEPEAAHAAVAAPAQVSVGAGCCCPSARSHHSFLEKVAIALLLPLMGYLLPLLRLPPQTAQALCQAPPHSSVR